MSEEKFIHNDIVAGLATVQESIRHVFMRLDKQDDALSALQSAQAELKRSGDIQIGKSTALKAIGGTALAGLGAAAVKVIEFFTAQPPP